MPGLRADERQLITELVKTPHVYRRRAREGQVPFWRRLGVTQSGGSRYERDANARKMPLPVAILASLYALGYVSADDLDEIREALEPLYAKRVSTEAGDGPHPPALKPAAKARAAAREILRVRRA